MANLVPPLPPPRRRVGAQVSYVAANGREAVSPGADHETWRAELQVALGTTSDSFVDACLQRLLWAVTMPNHSVCTSTSVSAALAMVQSLEPENEAQAGLAVNIACLHAASANLMSRLGRGCTERGTLMCATAVSRLERAYHDALETYYRIKRGNTQVIRVEKLVVQPGAQAVVGSITSNTGRQGDQR